LDAMPIVLGFVPPAQKAARVEGLAFYVHEQRAAELEGSRLLRSVLTANESCCGVKAPVLVAPSQLCDAAILPLISLRAVRQIRLWGGRLSARWADLSGRPAAGRSRAESETRV
jgi:hypothetical protein